MKKSTIIKVTLALTLCLLTLILCHFCTHDVRVNFRQDSNRYIYEFAYLDGEYKTEVNLAGEKNIDIISDFEGGKYSLSIKRNDGMYMFDERNMEPNSFGLIVPADGKYTFKISGHKIKGKFEIVILN